MLDQAMPKEFSKDQRGGRSKYQPPSDMRQQNLSRLLETSGRSRLEAKQLEFLRSGDKDKGASSDIPIYFSGDLSLIDKPCVAIVGSRKVSREGRMRASRLARELVEAGFVVVSGLAEGVDESAHTSAIASGGSTIAAIGTPLDRAYPAKHARLQEQIYAEHLLVSPFPLGEKTYPSSFPKRNRIMAALTDATVIIEASDTSGTLHQAAECAKLGRWLFIARSLAERNDLDWPKKFIGKPKTGVLRSALDVIAAVLKDRDGQT